MNLARISDPKKSCKFSKFIWLATGFAVAISIILSCAVRQAPPGGPEDKTPPKVMETDPPQGATGIATTSRFTIIFSKPMNRELTEKAVFLSPVFWDYPTLKWSGDKLTITPPEQLKPDKTYILTIGSNATDYRQNKMGISYNFAFSTGAVIDTGSISGAIFSEEPQKILYDIWAYSLIDSGTLDFWTRIPDYATQVDSSGAFSISNLGVGKYLVIAVDDRNDDLFWDPSAESMGLPPAIIRLLSEERVRGLILRPARRDTTTATISKVNPVNRQRLEVEFSQIPDSNVALNMYSYQIKYLDSDSTLPIIGTFVGEGNKLNIETDPQIDGKTYRFIGSGLHTAWGTSFDTAGTRFKGSGIPDSTGAKLLATYPLNKSNNAAEDTSIELTFSERIKTQGIVNLVTVLADSTDTLRFAPYSFAPNKLRLRFTTPIPRERKINVQLSPKQILDSFNNSMPDSSLEFSFRLPPADTMGSITGQIEADSANGPIIGILNTLEKGGRRYKSKPDRDGMLAIENIMPGNYRIEFFEDSDSNGEWSAGKVNPFVPAERFSFLADTLKVRSRWSTDFGAAKLPNFPH